jgi:phenylalanyl-tRNA synthetase alpha subunit
MVEGAEVQDEVVESIDVTAPFDVNTESSKRPRLLTADKGSIHPLMKELEAISDIFTRMGFDIEESRQIDDDYHMFESLNFPMGLLLQRIRAPCKIVFLRNIK